MGFLKRAQKFVIKLTKHQTSKPIGHFFPILWPFHNILTLWSDEIITKRIFVQCIAFWCFCKGVNPISKAVCCDCGLPAFWHWHCYCCLILTLRQKLSQFLGVSSTMRRNLLNWCNLVSIDKKLMFYVFGVIRIY